MSEKKIPNVKRYWHAMVRDDLQILVQNLKTSPYGAVLRTDKQKKELDVFAEGHEWEWLCWVKIGRTQLGGQRPLKGKLAQFKKALDFNETQKVILASDHPVIVPRKGGGHA